jgi:hypothetical protein
MRIKLPYYFFTLLSQFKRILFLILIVYITISPVFKTEFLQIASKYELAEVFEEDSREKEMIIDDFEDEDQKLIALRTPSPFYFHKVFTDHNQDVPQPPPKRLYAGLFWLYQRL